MTCILYTGNVLDILPTLEDESINCVVTSPPYWALRDYGNDGQLGLESTPDEYVARMVAVFREVWRVLRDDGTLWLNLGDSYAADRGGTYMPAETLSGGVSGQGDESTMRGRGDKDNGNARRNCTKYGLKHKDLCGIPWRVAFALQADGWYLRSDIIWSKPNPMPESVTDRPTKAHEYLFLMTKQARYWYDAEAVAETLADANSQRTTTHYDAYHQTARATTTTTGMDALAARMRSGAHTTRNRRTVWHIATQPYADAHFATYPEKLVEPCVLAGCPSQVCSACGAPYDRVTDRPKPPGVAPSDVAAKPLALCNSKNVPIYLLCFAAANERGAPTAVKIAQDVMLKEMAK